MLQQRCACPGSRVYALRACPGRWDEEPGFPPASAPAEPGIRVGLPVSPSRRSEEHTSELQSLMRISYAVFCLKKKKQKKNKPSIHYNTLDKSQDAYGISK